MSEVTENQINDYALGLHNDGANEDSIIDGIRSEFGLSVVKAIRAFKQFQKSAGLVMSNAEKAEQAEVCIKNNIVDDVLDQVTAVAEIADTLSLTASAARRYVKKFANANPDITVQGGSRPTADYSEYEDTVLDMINEGKGRSDIGQYLADEFDSVEDVKRGKRIYSAIARKHDLLKHRESVDYTQAFQWLAEQTEDITRVDTKQALVEMGYTSYAASRFYNGVKFMEQKAQFDATGSALAEAA